MQKTKPHALHQSKRRPPIKWQKEAEDEYTGYDEKDGDTNVMMDVHKLLVYLKLQPLLT